MKTKRITLYHTPDCWMADFHGDPEVVGAMGTDQLPCGFTGRAPVTLVLAEIRRLNPDAVVKLRGA